MAQQISVSSSRKEETAYNKEIKFTYDGKEYSVILWWDNYDGYELTWLDEIGKRIPTPEWVDDWHNAQPESLVFTLDNLSDGVVNESV